MEKVINIICATLCGLIVYSSNKIYAIEHTYKSEHFTAVYELTEGHLTGKYTSYYNNGNKKAEGFLQNGYRAGNWKLWDSIGNLSVELNYLSPFNRIKVFPPLPQDPTIQLFENDSFVLHPNSNSFNPFLNFLSQNTTDCKAQIELDNHYNSLILKSSFVNSVVQMINSGELEAFDCTKNANWPEKWDKSFKFSKKDVKKINVLESFIFDFQYMLSTWWFEGIEIYFQNKESKKEVRLLIYHLSLKEVISKIQINTKLFPNSITSLNDWFYQRYYIGKSTSIACYNAKVFQFHDWTIEMLEKEHNFWKSLS